MTRGETRAGTPVIDMTDAEYRAFLEDETRTRLNMSLADFVSRYSAGQLDDSDPDVPLLAMWVGMGQNGHRVPA